MSNERSKRVNVLIRNRFLQKLLYNSVLTAVVKSVQHNCDVISYLSSLEIDVLEGSDICSPLIPFFDECILHAFC